MARRGQVLDPWNSIYRSWNVQNLDPKPEISPKWSLFGPLKLNLSLLKHSKSGSRNSKVIAFLVLLFERFRSDKCRLERPKTGPFGTPCPVGVILFRKLGYCPQTFFESTLRVFVLEMMVSQWSPSDHWPKLLNSKLVVIIDVLCHSCCLEKQSRNALLSSRLWFLTWLCY